MIYKSISVKNILGRVIRNLDNKLPAHYLDYMLEWIPEAMEELQTPFALITKSTGDLGDPDELITKQHVAKLPCGLVHIIAVEDEYGNRVREGRDVTDITSPTHRYVSDGQGSLSGARTTNFQKDVRDTRGVDPATSAPGASIPWDGSDIVQKDNIINNNVPFYKIQMDHIQTSPEEMYLKIHYKSLPVDAEGYPLVPDVTEYKEALYWYVMEKLIGSGFKHPVLPHDMRGMEYCHEKYEFYAGRALGKIKMPTQDRMAKLRDGFAQRMVPPNHFYDDFGTGGEQVQRVIGI